MMNVGSWLAKAQTELADSEILTARLDAIVLLEDALGIDRTSILAHPNMEIPMSIQNVLNTKLQRRLQHEPLAYIRGTTEFYGRNFVVSPAVLEPRPESETMIDLLKSVHAEHCNDIRSDTSWRIADVGTGSGALGITAALELPTCRVLLLEVDDSAIESAKLNVIKLTTGLPVIKSDLLGGLSEPVDVLLCNLPYVPDKYEVNAAAQYEPAIALYGGPDGLDLYRRLFEQVSDQRSKPLLILTEALPSQHTLLRALAEASGYNLLTTDHFIQVYKLANYP